MPVKNPLGAWLDLHCDIAPVDLNTGANTGSWFNITEYQGILAVLITGAGTAADVTTVHFDQATSVTGGGSKDLNDAFTTYWSKAGATVNTVGTWTKNSQTVDEDVAITTSS